jgi:hypothetical protein
MFDRAAASIAESGALAEVVLYDDDILEVNGAVFVHIPRAVLRGIRAVAPVIEDNVHIELIDHIVVVEVPRAGQNRWPGVEKGLQIGVVHDAVAVEVGDALRSTPFGEQKKKIIDVDLAVLIEIGEILALIGDAVVVAVEAGPVGDVLLVVHAIAVAVVCDDPSVVDVLFAVERGGLGDVRTKLIGDHVVVIADLVPLRPADVGIEGGADGDVL